ncbi:hypothetical protein ABEB36_004054 [Hypothenemus hampei]|uniref:RING finger protein 141 n=1 Tax=Hypothenemus hampei TaxID=57062 RepID=A0ABD1F213_HYPHA
MGEVLSQITGEDHVTLLTTEICQLTYEEFLDLIKELNKLAEKCLDSKGYQLIFVVKKDSDTTIFWKATVKILCIKIDSQNQKDSTFRILSLSQFLKAFNTIKCQIAAVEQSKNKTDENMGFSTLLENALGSIQANDKINNECVICFERKQDVTLPCAHSFCTKCIEEWNELHDTCPICREKLDSPSDTWVISEAPNAEEISNEIRENLLDLSEDRPTQCRPS